MTLSTEAIPGEATEAPAPGLPPGGAEGDMGGLAGEKGAVPPTRKPGVNRKVSIWLLAVTLLGKIKLFFKPKRLTSGDASGLLRRGDDARSR